MDSFDKIESAISLKKIKTVPVAPMIISYAGRCSEMKQEDIFTSLNKWQLALERTIQKVGRPDAVFPLWPRDAAQSQLLRVLLPGRELGPDEQFQYVEEEVMQREDYDHIIKNGYRSWFMKYIPKIRSDFSSGRLKSPRIIFGFIQQGTRIRHNVRYWEKQKIPAMFYSACYPAFDLFSLTRSLEQFSYDLYECPEIIEQACEAATSDIIRIARIPLRLTGGKRVCIFPMRSSASFISPQMFSRFVLPNLKRMVETFARDNIVSVLHCDGNWTPMLPYLRELPRASCIIELDGTTDIYKAKEILGDWLCIKGDVPASMLAYGEPEQIMEYCGKLIRDIGHDGGFILSSGCEVPLDAKDRNVAAIIESCR